MGHDFVSPVTLQQSTFKIPDAIPVYAAPMPEERGKDSDQDKPDYVDVAPLLLQKVCDQQSEIERLKVRVKELESERDAVHVKWKECVAQLNAVKKAIGAT